MRTRYRDTVFQGPVSFSQRSLIYKTHVVGDCDFWCHENRPDFTLHLYTVLRTGSSLYYLYFQVYRKPYIEKLVYMLTYWNHAVDCILVWPYWESYRGGPGPQEEWKHNDLSSFYESWMASGNILHRLRQYRLQDLLKWPSTLWGEFLWYYNLMDIHQRCCKEDARGLAGI